MRVTIKCKGTCNKVTGDESSFSLLGSPSDEVYALVAVKRGNDSASARRPSNDGYWLFSEEDKSDWDGMRVRDGMHLASFDLAEGEAAEILVTVMEQDNESLGSVLSTLDSLSKLVAQSGIGVAISAVWDALRPLLASADKWAHDSIGVFGLKVELKGGALQVSGRAIATANHFSAQSTGPRDATFTTKLDGSGSSYELAGTITGS